MRKNMPTAVMCLAGVMLLALLSACKTPDTLSSAQNVDVHDPSQPVPDQAWLGSCQSFGVMGLIEQNYFAKTGISVGLSARYWFKALVQSAGEDFATIAEAAVTNHLHNSVVPESAYPYAYITDKRGLIDAATLIETSPAGAAWDDSAYLEKTLVDLAQHFYDANAYLEGPTLFGPLAQKTVTTAIPDSTPLSVTVDSFTIPVVAQAIPASVAVPTLDGVPCFVAGDALASSKTATTYPGEFGSKCLGLDTANYQVTNFFTDEGTREPMDNKAFAAVQASLDQRSAVVLAYEDWGLETPFYAAGASLRSYGVTAENYRRKAPIGGHAVLVTGYITAAELNDVNAHGKGYLRDDSYERLALLYDLTLASARASLFSSDSEYVNALATNDDKLAALKLVERIIQLRQVAEATNETLDQAAEALDPTQKPSVDALKALASSYQSQRKTIEAAEDTLVTFLKGKVPSALSAQLSLRYTALRRVTARPPQMVPTTSESPLFTVKSSADGSQLTAVFTEEPSWVVKSLPAPVANETLQARQTRRLAYPLSQIVASEGGFLIAKNSWGANAGISGFYYLGYSYLRTNADSTGFLTL